MRYMAALLALATVGCTGTGWSQRQPYAVWSQSQPRHGWSQGPQTRINPTTGETEYLTPLAGDPFNWSTTPPPAGAYPGWRPTNDEMTKRNRAFCADFHICGAPPMEEQARMARERKEAVDRMEEQRARNNAELHRQFPNAPYVQRCDTLPSGRLICQVD